MKGLEEKLGSQRTLLTVKDQQITELKTSLEGKYY